MAHNMDQSMRADSEEVMPTQGQKRKKGNQPTKYEYRGPPAYLMASLFPMTIFSNPGPFCCHKLPQDVQESNANSVNSIPTEQILVSHTVNGERFQATILSPAQISMLSNEEICTMLTYPSQMQIQKISCKTPTERIES